LVGFILEYRAENAMQALKQMAITNAKVVRNGNIITVPSVSLVPGDIVMLEAGDAVPADIRIASSIHLKIEEAALTGESQPVEKITAALEIDDLPVADQTNMAFKGTFVSYGRGTGIVTATGMGTELGRIAKMLQSKDVLTPLQQRMAAFGKKLSILILFLCVLFFTVGFLQKMCMNIVLRIII
jgi:Ca2+-transporting ATPase